jgi:hypothetical protein
MNPNNDAYWESRGYDGRPSDWDEDGYEKPSRDPWLDSFWAPHGR